MSNYYTTNAMYEYLEDNETPGFLFAKENIWLLIYGTAASEPRFILVASAVSRQEMEELTLGEHEEDIINVASRLSEKSGLNAYVLRYCKNDAALKDIQLINLREEVYVNTSIEQLYDLFEGNGLSPSGTGSAKSVNDKVSSAFHKWQRANLGKEICASDIDLLRMDGEEPVCIYELKRSYYTLERWEPFSDDFPNYKLIATFASMANMDFQIVYNRRTTSPFFDDISTLKRFTFSPQNERARYLDTISLEDFLRG